MATRSRRSGTASSRARASRNSTSERGDVAALKSGGHGPHEVGAFAKRLEREALLGELLRHLLQERLLPRRQLDGDGLQQTLGVGERRRP